MNNKRKTRICRNAKNCKFGDACHYAHSIDEITLNDCLYGNSCIFVKVDENGDVKNDLTKGKICFFRHDKENIKHYSRRIEEKVDVYKPFNQEPIVVKQSIITPIKLDIESEDLPWLKAVKTVKVAKKEVCEVKSEPLEMKFHISEINNVVDDIVTMKHSDVMLRINYD